MSSDKPAPRALCSVPLWLLCQRYGSRRMRALPRGLVLQPGHASADPLPHGLCIRRQRCWLRGPARGQRVTHRTSLDSLPGWLRCSTASSSQRVLFAWFYSCQKRHVSSRVPHYPRACSAHAQPRSRAVPGWHDCSLSREPDNSVTSAPRAPAARAREPRVPTVRGQHLLGCGIRVLHGRAAGPAGLELCLLAHELHAGWYSLGGALCTVRLDGSVPLEALAPMAPPPRRFARLAAHAPDTTGPRQPVRPGRTVGALGRFPAHPARRAALLHVISSDADGLQRGWCALGGATTCLQCQRGYSCSSTTLPPTPCVPGSHARRRWVNYLHPVSCWECLR